MSVSRQITPKNGPNRRQGFTLIEILVVVAIIALLISILLPSLKRARDQAKMSLCNAHLHDFGTSHTIYATEQKGYFPPPQYLGAPYDGCVGCDDNLFVLWFKKYSRDVNLWSCPARTYRVRIPEQITLNTTAFTNGNPWYDVTTGGVPGRNDFYQIAIHTTNPAKGFGTSYEYNGWLSDQCTGAGTSTKITWHPGWQTAGPTAGAPKSTRAKKPRLDTMILMHDADDGPIGGGNDIMGAPPGRATNNYPEPWDNHGKFGMNMLFGDGHAIGIRQWETDASGGGGKIWLRDRCGPP